MELHSHSLRKLFGSPQERIAELGRKIAALELKRIQPESVRLKGFSDLEIDEKIEDLKKRRAFWETALQARTGP